MCTNGQASVNCNNKLIPVLAPQDHLYIMTKASDLCFRESDLPK